MPVKEAVPNKTFLVEPKYYFFSLASVILIYRSFEVRCPFSARCCSAWDGTVVPKTETERCPFLTSVHLFFLYFQVNCMAWKLITQKPISWVDSCASYRILFCSVAGIHVLFIIASCYQKSTFVVLQMTIKCRNVYQQSKCLIFLIYVIINS